MRNRQFLSLANSHLFRKRWPMSRESRFIENLRQIATGGAARGLSDDVATLQIGDETLVLTHDSLVEGIHTLQGQDLADIGWKLVASNISDLAAKGAEPLGVLLGHTLGNSDQRFIDGLNEALIYYDAQLYGGDTVRVPEGSARVWGITAIGRATYVPVPSRSGAQVGNGVYVTGPLGAAMMGYEALRDGTGANSQAYRKPQARLAEGQGLAPIVTAMMDISDGLLLDAWRMGNASGAALAIDSPTVPIASPEDRRDDAMRWGDDYELLFTAPKGAIFPCEVHRIGTVERGEAPLVLDGEPLTKPDGLGYQH